MIPWLQCLNCMNERRDCYRVDIDNMRMVTTCGAATVRMIYYNNMKVEGHVESGESEEEENCEGKSLNAMKRKARAARKLERQHLRDKELKMEREETRRLRIEELKSAQVFKEQYTES